jgi:hypothetical protein
MKFKLFLIAVIFALVLCFSSSNSYSSSLYDGDGDGDGDGGAVITYVYHPDGTYEQYVRIGNIITITYFGADGGPVRTLTVTAD